MDGEADVTVLRLGHRPGRDERTTTHVGLTARALGADGVVLADHATDRRDSLEEITDRFGGPFRVETTRDPAGTIADWGGRVVHLTMYGLPIQEVEAAVRAAHRSGEALLVVVGAEKVPFEIYESADWNLAVTNQPHSEIAALAVFLDHLFEGRELDREWDEAQRQVLPEPAGKTVRDIDDE